MVLLELICLPPDSQENRLGRLRLASQPAKSLDTRFASEHVDVPKAQTFASWLIASQGGFGEQKRSIAEEGAVHFKKKLALRCKLRRNLISPPHLHTEQSDRGMCCLAKPDSMALWPRQML